VAFIAERTGLAISCPKVPSYLTLPDEKLASAVDQLSPAQKQWHEELTQKTLECSGVLRGDKATRAERVQICEWVWNHLLKAVPYPSDSVPAAAAPLWPEPSTIATKWTELLHNGTRVIRDSRPMADAPNRGKYHSYTLRVQGANALLTHILACQFISYGHLRSEVPEITNAWRSLLENGSPQTTKTRSSSSASTDSSSSDDEDGWERVSRSAKKQAKQQERRAHARLPRDVAKFERSHMVGDVAARFEGDTALPLLALSTSIRVRAWEQRYTSCLVDNFQSIDCNVMDLERDANFIRVSTEIPELRAPLAAWSVNQFNGGATATIFVREDYKDVLLTLNSAVKRVLPHTTPELRVKCTVLQANSRGRAIFNLPRTSVYLNDSVPVLRPPVNDRRLPDAPRTSLTAPPTVTPFLAAVLAGIKRVPVVSTLDHRPKKKTVTPASEASAQQQGQPDRAVLPAASKRTAPPTTAVTPSISAPPSPSNTDVALQQLAERLALLEQRLTTPTPDPAIAALTLNMQSLTRNLEALTARFETQQKEQAVLTTSLNILLEQLRSPAPAAPRPPSMVPITPMAMQSPYYVQPPAQMPQMPYASVQQHMNPAYPGSAAGTAGMVEAGYAFPSMYPAAPQAFMQMQANPNFAMHAHPMNQNINGLCLTSEAMTEDDALASPASNGVASHNG
jgi:hypothetical protein